MGQKIVNAGDCTYCAAPKMAVYYTGMYPQDEILLETHCNTCKASWEPDGTPRAIPSQTRLEQLGVLGEVIRKGLPYSTKPEGEWFRDYKPTGNKLG